MKFYTEEQPQEKLRWAITDHFCQFKQSCIENCFGKCIDLYPEMKTKCGIQNVAQTENSKFVSGPFWIKNAS